MAVSIMKFNCILSDVCNAGIRVGIQTPQRKCSLLSDRFAEEQSGITNSLSCVVKECVSVTSKISPDLF